MAALAYRDDKILARNLLLRPFFCLTPAEPFFRPDRSTTAPLCRVAVKDGRAFRGHPKGLSLYGAFEVKHLFHGILHFLLLARLPSWLMKDAGISPSSLGRRSGHR